MNDISSELVKIPSERVKIILGNGGEVKKEIETNCKVTLHIEAAEGDVEISGEPTEVFFAKDVVKAIGRGFLPKEAFKLLNQDYNLCIISLKELIDSDKAIVRLKGRVIGEDGRMKIDIEEATDSVLCIYGNTIGIISHIDSIGYAKEAVMMLLDGAPHATVINYLAKAKRILLESRLKG